MNPIREAAARLKGHWYQGHYRDDNGNACGLGHLFDVMAEKYASNDDAYINALEHQEENGPAKLMREVAIELFPERWDDGDRATGSFAIFNDHPDTTEDEVVAVMEKAAIRLDERI